MRARQQGSDEALVVFSLEDGRVVSCNEEARRLLGHPEEKFEGLTTSNLPRKETRNAISSALARLSSSRSITLPKLTLNDCEGRERALELRASSIDVGGQRLGVCSFKDVTEREKLRERVASWEEKVQTFQGLHSLSSTVTDVESFIFILAEHMQLLLPYTKAKLFLLTSGQRFDIVPNADEKITVSRLKPDLCYPGLPRWLEGRDVVESWTEESSPPTLLLPCCEEEKDTAGCALPLRHRGRQLGCMVLSRSEGTFNEGEQALATWIARSASSCLGNVIALESAEVHVGRLKSLSERCASFLTERSEDKLYELIVNAALDLFPSADGAAIVVGQPSGVLRIGHLAGYPAAELAKGVVLPPFEGFPLTILEDEIPGVLYSSREVDGPHSDDKRPVELIELIEKVCGGYLPQSTLAVPVGLPEERVGVLILDSLHEDNAFDERDLNLATIMGSHAGGAICYARNLKLAQERQEEIAKSSQQRIEFVAGLVHEVKTPLTVFRGFLDLLMEENLSNDGRRYVELMAQDAARLGRTMNDLLQLARIEAGAPATEVRYERPDVVIGRVLEEFRIPCRDKGVHLRAALQELGELKFIDEPRLTQILRNLLENALKFTEAGGEISVGGALEEENILISVADTGRGIDKEDLPYLTDSFYQVRKTGAESKDGVGLGLAIVKRLLDSLGGQLNVESTPGEGSCFQFSYPTVNEGG